MITESCKRDFFTIRADCVQDAVLASVDSLAEYLVWDGMDRRARAIASANHTGSPEAVVSISQIAADIKMRVGHDLCERTIERAIRKLNDAGLIGIESRFNAGRRQASSYRLLFSDGMKSRLDATRRGRKASPGNPSEQPRMTPNRDEYRPTPEPARAETREASVGHIRPLQDQGCGLTRIGLMAQSFLRASSERASSERASSERASSERASSEPPAVESASTSDSEAKESVGNQMPGQSEHICTQAMTGDMEGQSEQNIQTSHAGTFDGSHDSGLTIKSEPLQRESATIHHPTSMSPLFNKEEKENKKVFKNVFSIDARNKNQPKPSRLEPCLKTTGYYLDDVHQKGWVTATTPHLLPHRGDLSRYAFFEGHKSLESLTLWFQEQEDAIANGRVTVNDVLAQYGVETIGSATPPQVIAAQSRFGC
jgi:hypothetical protein